MITEEASQSLSTSVPKVSCGEVACVISTTFEALGYCHIAQHLDQPEDRHRSSSMNVLAKGIGSEMRR